MKQQRWSQRLVVALLVMGVSSGLGMGPSGPADAHVPPAGQGHMGGALPGPGGLRAAWPATFASSGRAPAAAGPALLATSPITWTQQAELTSTAEVPNDGFGGAVAVSGDTAVVGALDTPPATSYGAAYLFARSGSGSTWMQQAALSDPGSVYNDWFGYAVAVSGDTAVIGAPGATGLSADTGAAYVYVRSGGAWTLQATLIAADGAYIDGFGYAVAISGSTILVGAPGKTSGNGAAYVFVRSGSTWTQQAALSGGAFAEFGWAVALSGDTAVIAAVQTPDAYVYVRSGGAWSLQATLADPGPSEGRYYGVGVAVAGDTALVSLTESPFRVNGVVYVFGRRGTTWTPQAALSPPAGTTATSFGTSLGLSGATAVVDGNGAWTFVGRGSVWREQAQLIPSDRAANAIGGGAAVSGNTAVVGAVGPNGSAYVFVRSRVGDTTPADDSGTALRPAPLGRVR